MKAGLTIGEMAVMVGLTAKTIRYYEEVGLLPNPRRSESGYRLYSTQDVGRLRLIRRARLLGLSLAETKDIVAFAVERKCTGLRHHLLTLVSAKVAEVDERVKELLALRQELLRYQHELSRSEAGTGEEQPCVPQEPCACMG